MSFFNRRILVTAAVFGLLSVNAWAQENGTRDEAKAMVDAAVEHVKKVGPDQAFKDFTNKENKAWQKKDLYVFAYNSEGVNMAHGANDKLVGKNLIDLKDPNGKPLIRELRDTAQKGGGWVEYDWPHPQSKKIESKISYTRKMTNFDGFIGVGVYR
ncbi:cache domain-containing protein [Acidovorax sp. RAC01]|uniref:cache domain-containing protein n=1 Tax=Acidovorax sp. RAC01 TaxID=1842533 RepID=UPI00083E6E76|nr:cache domain-containing protein [Acidovorax sp. RAC01]AOG24183.1 cache domain protein [Acidovorax sp. RAC01]